MSKNLGGLNRPPSLFDIGLYLFTFLCPIFILGSWNLNMVQGLFFNFGVFALFGLSFFCKKEREFNSKYLGFFIIWSLALAFVHSFRFSLLNSIPASFINFCIMSEGFIFVLSGCILYYLISSYSKNYKLLYPILALNILNLVFVITQLSGIDCIWVGIKVPCGMFGTIYQLKVFSAMSIPILFNFRIKDIWYPIVVIPIFILITGLFYNSWNAVLAVWITFLIYLYHRRHREFFFVILGIGLIPIFLNFNVFLAKVWWRLDLFLKTAKEIIKSPFIGHGFDNGFNPNLIFDLKGSLAYRQNDYLQTARDLGLPFLGAVVLFIRKVLKGRKIDWLWMAVMILLISSCFQSGIYFTRVGMWGIVLLALKNREVIV